MAVAIRMRQEGTRNRPFFRIVVADSRHRRDGRFIEMLGHYDPLAKGEGFALDLAKAESWIAKGAQPSETAASLIKRARRAASAESAG
jgi:small subunit ribosomal protein S16